MAKRELTGAQLRIVQAVEPHVRHGEVALACSGGADSLSLVCAVAHLVRRGRVAARVKVHTVNHQLQPGSGEVAARVKQSCSELGLQASVHTVDVVDNGDGMEASARRARYQALAAAMNPDDICLLGHTMDDQAETVLLGMIRGSGTRSLAGMAPWVRHYGRLFVRPLLGVRRHETVQACLDWGVQPWDDPHNDDPRFTRVALRTRVIPLLEAEFGTAVTDNLARTASLARDDADALDTWVEGLMPAQSHELPVALLVDQPPAIASRIVRQWLIANGVDQPSFERVTAVMELVTAWRGQKGIDVPSGHVTRTGQTLVFTP